MRTWGFITDSAADGEEALQRITVFRPTIIVSDLVMPRMGGLELLKALKADDSECTVVLLTAQGSVETAVEAIKEGAYDYLTKPYRTAFRGKKVAWVPRIRKVTVYASVAGSEIENFVPFPRFECTVTRPPWSVIMP